jgi:mono/diheme cytochrome c family protein
MGAAARAALREAAMGIARMLRFGSLALGAALLLAPSPAPAQQAAAPDLVARGKYLATAGDCTACHTVPGGTPYAGGRDFKLPFGTLYSRNITPDVETGIGSWNDDDFVRAMQQGIAKGGEHLYPVFPYTAYTRLSRDDVLAIKAYLFSLPPAHNVPPANTLAFPFNQRWTLAVWNLLFNPDARLEPDPAQSADWNRGAYLVEGLEHCGECHTPRRVAQSLNNSRKFAGAVAQGWMAYNITGDKQSGLGGWSDAALTAYLTTGHGGGHSSASGPMDEAIDDSLRALTADDIHAIVVYLRSIAPIETVPAIAQTPPAATEAPPPGGLGEKVFADNCANCHNWDGSGTQSSHAALVGSRTVNDAAATNLLAILLSGSNAKRPTEPGFMPPFGSGHSDDELAAVANFVNLYFGDGTAKVTAADVDKERKALP